MNSIKRINIYLNDIGILLLPNYYPFFKKLKNMILSSSFWVDNTLVITNFFSL